MRDNAKPTVSIIVPSYNHAPFLSKRIESILGQTFEDYELILLDDASRDESREIIHAFQSKYGNIRVFLNDLNSGSPFRQWDFGVRQARGEYLWIAESDDFADHNFLAEMVPILKRNDRVGLAYCDAQLVDESNRPGLMLSDSRASYAGDRWKKDFVNRGMNEIEEYLSRFCTINNTSGVLFRKTAYENAGMADHGFAYCGDWLLYLKILRRHDLAYRAAPLNFIRIHPGSTCHRYYRNNAYLEEVLLVLRHLADSFKINPQIKDNIEYRLAWEFLVALRHGFIPSRHICRCLKKIDPFFELHAIRQAFKHGCKACIPNAIIRKRLRLLAGAPFRFPRDLAWKRKFGYRRDPVSVDIRWAMVNTHGFIRVPLGMLRAPIRTAEGELLMPIEETPHYPWIKALVVGSEDVRLREKYREYLATYFPGADPPAELERVVALVALFKARADHASLITIVTHLPTRYQGSDYVVICDGVHRSAIATALGHEFVRCRLAASRINRRDFGRRIVDSPRAGLFREPL